MSNTPVHSSPDLNCRFIHGVVINPPTDLLIIFPRKVFGAKKTISHPGGVADRKSATRDTKRRQKPHGSFSRHFRLLSAVSFARRISTPPRNFIAGNRDSASMEILPSGFFRLRVWISSFDSFFFLIIFKNFFIRYVDNNKIYICKD